MSLNPDTTLTRVVYRNAVFFFAVILLAAFWGFWPRYFSNPLRVSDYYLHVHGIALTLWCVMLVAQGYLVRSDRRAIHRQLGKLSYVLAPIVFLSTLGVIHHGNQGGAATDRELLLIGITLNNVLLFGITAGLGIYHRREPTIHARYMLCTPLPMFAPIFSRILLFNFASHLGFVPQMDGRPFVQLVSFVASDTILAILATWDWASNRRLRVFPVMLAVFVVTHVSLFVIYDQRFWASFVEWFLNLPLT